MAQNILGAIKNLPKAIDLPRTYPAIEGMDDGAPEMIGLIAARYLRKLELA